MTVESSSERSRRTSLAAAIVSISVVGASFGHTLPFFAIRQEALGADASFIGANAAMMALAALLATPFLPRILRRAGLRLFLAVSLAMIAAGIVGIALAAEQLWLWFPLRFLMGLGAAGAWVASELWILTLARPGRRGALLGVYAMSLAAGFALGPVALELTGYEGALPFIAPLAMIALSLALVIAARLPDTGGPVPARPMLRLLPAEPTIFGAAAVFAAAEASVLALGPLYALDLGHDQSAAGRMVIVYGLGAIALQFLIGRASDLARPRRIILGCALVGLGGAAALPVAGQNLATLLPLVFLWGGAIVGLYTVGLNLLGARYSGPDLPAANAGMVFSYNLGALAGPVLAGLAVDAMGPGGLPTVLAGLFGLYIALLLLSGWSRRP